MSEAPPPEQASNGAPAAGYAQIHFLDNKNYDEMVRILAEYTGFVFSEAQKPEPLTQEKLSLMLSIYIQNCLRKGVPPDAAAPAGAKCQHRYVKKDKEGQICGASAKYVGVEGLPKCSSHKASKPAKAATDPTAVAGGGAAAQTFSYSNHQGKGKVAPQGLTAIQASIREQTEPPQISLDKLADGRFYNRATNIQFENREGKWIAMGVVNGPVTNKLTVTDVHVCYGNNWAWDPACVEDPAAAQLGHPLVAGADHPLLAGSNNNALMAKKIESVINNNLAGVPQ